MHDTHLFLTLAAGQRARLPVSPHSLIACAEGTAFVTETAWGDGWSETGAPRADPCVPLHAGQSHRVDVRGIVTVHAPHGARLYCVVSVPRWRRVLLGSLRALSKCAILISSRRGVEQSGSSSGS